MKEANKKLLGSNQSKEDLKCSNYSTNVSAQRSRLLAWLQKRGCITTQAARDELSIMHPAARKLELIKIGYMIVLQWCYESDKNGVVHRIGKYVYMGMRKEAA